MDRNKHAEPTEQAKGLSLSARRAWIEIPGPSITGYLFDVALRKESVDRNIILAKQLVGTPPSLSARRAWIEISRPTTGTQDQYVALRKESVDRNYAKLTPPHKTTRSLSARRAWIEILAYRRAPPRCRRRSPQGERG